tara:strand:+ start:1303 stop:4488 length:3186 start_codon:yes stop_codon:yes gene_type:complete
MAEITLDDLYKAIIVADEQGRSEDVKELNTYVERIKTKGYIELPENVKDYERVVPSEVEQREQEQLTRAYASPYGMIGAQGAFGVREFLRYMGFGEYGETKSVEGVGEITRADELSYGLTKGTSTMGRLLLTAEAYAPSPKRMQDLETGRWLTVDPETYYDDALKDLKISGDEFVNKMSPDEREDILIEHKALMDRQAHEVTASVLDVAPADPTMLAIGTMLSEIADPLLVPIVLASGGGTVPLLASGGFYGLASEGSRQLHEDKLNVDELAKSTLVGLGLTAATAPIQTAGLVYKTAVRAPAVGAEKAGRKVYNLVNNTIAKRGGNSSADTASKIIDKIEQRSAFHLLNSKQTNGKPVTKKQALVLAEKDLGLTTANRLDVLKYAPKGKRPHVPTREQAVRIVANLDNPVPSTSAIGKAWDYIGAPISQTIRNFDKRLAGAVRNHDMRMSVALANSLKEVDQFITLMNQASKIKNPTLRTQYENIERALFSSQPKKAEQLLKKHFPQQAKGIMTEYGKVRTLLDTIHARGKQQGIKMSYLYNYMPRYVKDLEGLRKALGQKQSSVVDKALAEEAEKRGLGHWSELEDAVASDVITNAITRTRVPTGQKRLEAQRTIAEIPAHLKPYYHDVPTSLQLYINKAEREIAKQEFFGASAVYNPLTGKLDMDSSINNTIGKHVLDMKKRGKEFTTGQMDDLRLLLKARFEAADKAMGKTMANVRDLQYAALLGQFDSALIQLGDIGSSLYLNGVANTAKALVTGKKNAKLTADDFGLINQVSAEMNNLSGVTKLLDLTLKYSGFRAIDRFGKDTFLKASWIKNTNLARKNPQAIAQKYGEVFENETADLIKDLQNGLVTDRTKLLLWNELADVQPIALSEMPRAYLEMTNGRILYSLKSFGLKQLGLIRQNIIQRAQRGDVSGAFEEALRYSAVIGLSGGTVENARNFLRTGGDIDATQPLDDAAFEALAKILFVSKYARERFVQEGKLGEYALSLVTPAAPSLIDDAGVAVKNILFESETNSEAFNAAMNNVPLLGRAYYYGIGGGGEKLLERVEQEQRQKEQE